MAPGPRDPSDNSRGSPPRILVIDDNRTARSVLRQHLTVAPLMADLQEAGDAKTGLRMAFEQELDCVICDLDMPDMNGFTLVRIVRAQRSRMELPVILVTAENAVAAKINGFRFGASDFVTKPFEPGELVARIETQVTLARMHRELQRAAHVDPLTGAWNRRRFMEQLNSELARSQRLRRSASVLILDVDHFKKINDVHGHPVGDAVLTDLVRVIDASRRSYDGVGRIGGEEFALILPEANAIEAVEVAERIRTNVAAASLGSLAAGAVTVSIGAAEASPGKATTIEALCKRADEQLYAAKRLGRNRVCVDVVDEPNPAPITMLEGVVNRERTTLAS